MRVATQGEPLKSFYGKTFEQAEAKAREYMATWSSIKRDQLSAEASASFGIFLASNIAPLYADSPKNTRDQATWCLSILIDVFGRHKTRELTLADVLAGWAKIKTAHPNANTRRTIRRYLFRALRLAHKSGLVPYNFAEDISQPQAPSHLKVATPEQWAKLWGYYRNHSLWGPKFFLGFVLGLRDEEQNALTADMVGEDLLMVPGTKTASAERTIYLSPRIAEILKAYARGGRFVVRHSENGRVKNTINRDLKLAYERAEVPYCGNHGLRHGFGAIETSLGCPRSIYKAIVGHAKADVSDHYIHPTPENMREWLGKWEAFLALERPECLPSVSGTPVVQPKKSGQKR